MTGAAVSQNVAPFRWTTREERAAGLVAEDTLTNAEIGAAVGVRARTIERWKAHPAFAARVAELVAAAQAAAKVRTIANKERRVQRLQERSEKLDRVIAARAEQHAEVPGGDTGLLVREPKIVKVYDVKTTQRRGPTALAQEDDDDEQMTPTGGVQIVYEYRVDTATLAEMRQIEKQAAQELGEWVEKVAPTKADGSDLTLADLLALTQAGPS